MSVLYVKEQGAMLVKRNERLQVSKARNILLDIPVANLENVALIGNIQISTQALMMLLENGIDISYFTRWGKYLGHTAAESSKNIFLRFAQHELYHDQNARMELAKTIVRNKVQNQISLICNFRFENEYTWKDDVRQMEKTLLSLERKNTPNEILGVEGMCSNIYFGAYGKMFKSYVKTYIM